MKNTIKFLLILMTFSFTQVKAQQSDSTARLPLMKRKSQIFIAEIKTNVGTQKGILYEADSNKIVILDSLFHRVEVPISGVKLIIIKRMNPAAFGFKTGFVVPLIPATILEIYFFATGVSNAGLASILLVITPLAGLAFGLAFGGLMALASHNIPNKYINLERWQDEYLNQLKYIKTKTQKVLVKRYAKQTQLVY